MFISNHNPPVSRRTGLPGHMTDSEEEAIIRMAQSVAEDSNIAVVGDEWGRLSAAFLAFAPDSTYIDTCRPDTSNYQGLPFSVSTIIQRNLYRASAIPEDRRDAWTFWDCDPMNGPPSENSLVSYGAVAIALVPLPTKEQMVNAIHLWAATIETRGLLAVFNYGEHQPVWGAITAAVNEWLNEVGNDWIQIERVDGVIVFRRIATEPVVTPDEPETDAEIVYFDDEFDEDDDIDLDQEFEPDIEGILTTEYGNDYDSWDRDDLVALCNERGIHTGNSRDETLAAKLRAYDEEIEADAKG